MIERIELSGVHVTVDDATRKYALRKIGRLDRFVPRGNRKSLHATILLKEGKAKDKKACTCEVVLRVPGDTITTKDTTINMYAAIDIAEAKLKNQLKKYKDQHTTPGLHRRLLARLKHRPLGI